MSPFIALLLLLAIVGCAFLFLFRKLIGPSSISECDPAWVLEFSIERYRPMLRLLNEDDYEFLKSQPGYEPKLARQLRAERRRIFRAYLRSLSRDFQRLNLAAKMLVLYSPQDRPDLAAELMKRRLMFSLGVMRAEVCLVFHAAGIGTVDVRPLLGSLDTLRGQIGNFAVSEPTLA